MKKVILRLLGASAAMALVGCVGVKMAGAEGEPDGSTTFEVNLAQILEVTAPSTASINVDPGSETGIGTGLVDVTVATNNITGYTLMMYAGNDAKLVNADNASQFIPTLNADGQTDVMASINVGWGFRVTSNNSKDGENFVTPHFQTIPTTDATIAITDAPSNGDVTHLSFGVKVKGVNSLSAGTYTGVVNFVAVANEVPFVMPIENMQDITPTIIADMPEEEQFQLKDSRDGKSYWVAKLKDGNVWMTQNLAIEGATLNSETSDLASGTFVLPASSTSWETSDYDVPSVYVDENGGYYNWDAATAGTGRGMSNYGDEATGSICPKGWELPRSGDYQDSGSFYALWSQYMPDIDSHSWSGDPADSSVAPLSLAFSGNSNPSDGRVYGVGGFGAWWSSTVSAVNVAFSGNVYGYGEVLPAYTNVRLFGYSVRCWAPGA